MAVYYGESKSASGRGGRRYKLAGEVSHGTEGIVYDIGGMPGHVAKIYNQARYDAVTNAREGRPDGRAFMHAKLREMVRMGGNVTGQQWTSVDGHSFLAWPVDTLIDAGGVFCGYVMPRVRGKGNLYGAVDVYARDDHFGRARYTWKTSIRIAKQLAFVVGKLHESGIVVGDFNPQNFLLDATGLVSFVDIDSYTISPVYKTLVAFPGLVAPELQGMPWSSRRDSCQFTKESDRFSLACLIFQLLTEVHPFNAVVMRAGMVSVSQSSQELNIRRGDCPYVKSGIARRRADAPDVFGLLFPDYLRKLCIRCFDYTEGDALDSSKRARRPTAAEWYAALDKLERDGIRSCSKDPQHYYVPGAGTRIVRTCPWCERDDYLDSLRKKKVVEASAAITGNSGATKSAGSNVAISNQKPVSHASAQQVRNVTKWGGMTPAAKKFTKVAVVGILIALAVVCVLRFVVENWLVILIILVIVFGLA